MRQTLTVLIALALLGPSLAHAAAGGSSLGKLTPSTRHVLAGGASAAVSPRRVPPADLRSLLGQISTRPSVVDTLVRRAFPGKAKHSMHSGVNGISRTAGGFKVRTFITLNGGSGVGIARYRDFKITRSGIDKLLAK